MNVEQLCLFEIQKQQDIGHFTESPWEAIEQIDWDFKGEQTQYLTHTFHSYPARFIPQIPRIFIELFTREDDTVLDPFCGCGTTLVESALLNRKAIGVDMNPLACLISKAKTTIITRQKLLLLWKKVCEIGGVLSIREDDDVEYLTQEEFSCNKEVKLPNRKKSKLFTPEVMSELNTIREHVDKLKDDTALFNLALVALSSTIRAVIESELNKGLYYVFRRKVKMMISVLKEMNPRVRYTDVKVIQGDARQLKVPDTSVDLIVTSPPYVNALDYYRVHQYNMAWLGMDYKAFKQHEIGGHSHFITNRFRLLSEYLGDMLRAMIEMNRTLKSDKTCVIVVGNSSLEYELIESRKFFSAMAPDIGLKVRNFLFRNIDVSRKYHSQEIGKIDNEYIIVLQKVSKPPTTSDDDSFIVDIVRREMLKFKKQVQANPGSSLRGKKVTLERLKQNPSRLESAISTIEKDVKIK